MFGTKAKVAAGVMAGALLTGGLAYGAIPGNDGSITACYRKTGSLVDAQGVVRIVDNASQCRTYETAISWNQTGPKGDPGTPGAKGDKGDAGTPGGKGDKGDPGTPGAKGDKGDAGTPGAKGDKGDPGTPGAKGDTGTPGAKGDAGAKGDTGSPGAKGDPGTPGAKGDKGDAGTPGAKGDQGTPGAPGASGVIGTSVYRSGTFGLDAGSAFDVTNGSLVVSCAAGEVRLSGGYELLDVTNYTTYSEVGISKNGPSTTGQGWEVAAWNQSTEALTVRVYVVCGTSS